MWRIPQFSCSHQSHSNEQNKFTNPLALCKMDKIFLFFTIFTPPHSTTTFLLLYYHNHTIITQITRSSSQSTRTTTKNKFQRAEKRQINFPDSPFTKITNNSLFSILYLHKLNKTREVTTRAEIFFNPFIYTRAKQADLVM